MASLVRAYLVGVSVIGAGFLLSGLAPTVAVVLLTFCLAGLGNGVMLVYERLIIQATVPDSLTARVFGTKDSLTAWAFGLSFLAAGGLVSAFGAREVMIGSGAAVIGIAACAAFGLRRLRIRPLARRDTGAELLPRGRGSQHGAHLVVDDGAHWLTLLDDLDEGGDDGRVELRPGVRR
jgi:MFS family permease